MKKAIQKDINALVKMKFDEFLKVAQNESDISSQRLRYCNATVYENSQYYYLVSYRTMVAFIEKKTNTLVDVLRMVYGYTSTSAQHISKFDHDYCDKNKYFWGCTERLTYRDI